SSPILSTPPRSTLIPYTTLFRSSGNINKAKVEAMEGTAKFTDSQTFKLAVRSPYSFETPMLEDGFERSYFIKEKYNNEWNLKSKDRKSTRLNSSHVSISYAVFCL